MEVMPGYKHTSVGVIPEEWSIKPLFEIAELTSSKRIFESDYVPFGIPFYRGKEISMLIKAEVIDDPCFITEKRFNEIKIKFGAPIRGDILITAVGTLANVYVVNSDYPFYFKDGNLIWLRYIKDVEAPFLGIQLAWRRSAILDGAIGSSQKALTIEALNSLKVAIPSPKEQQAISTALNDIDALLNSLDRLIAKKRNLKQAAMQQLLLGRTRLPGFSGEWAVMRLGDIGEVSGSGVDKKSYSDETPVRLLNYMDVYRLGFIESASLDHWVTAQPNQLRRCSIQRGDLFFTPSSETRQDIANSSVALEDIPDAAYSYHVVRFRLKEKWDLKYCGFAFKTRDFLNQAEKICDGGGTRYVISLGKFRSLEVPVLPIAEQEAIGQILFDIDLEIKKLQSQKAKTDVLKQGMMQELLTGRTRLV